MNTLKTILISSLFIFGTNAIASETPSTDEVQSESKAIYECKGVSTDRDSHYTITVSAPTDSIQDNVALSVVENWGDGEELDQDDLNQVPTNLSPDGKIITIRQAEPSAFALITGLSLTINPESLTGTLKMDFAPSGKRDQGLNVRCVRK